MLSSEPAPKSHGRPNGSARIGILPITKGAMCLAIGDGANDVSMIQEADIGIGIQGKEGLQAVMASDYSISQFRFLARLLLVHGKWAYVRSSALVLNYFYKNVVFLLILFWHQFYSGFNAGLAMDFTYSMFFNTVFTLLPTMFIGIFDQDVNDTVSLLIPQLYKKGIRQELYNTTRFWLFTGNAAYQSVVCYFVCYFITSDGVIGLDGYPMDLGSMGTLIAFGVMIVVNAFSISSWHSWTYLTQIALWFSIAIWVAYVGAFSPDAYLILSSPIFYITLGLLVVVSLLPLLVIQMLIDTFAPSDTVIVKEILSLYKSYDWAKCSIGVSGQLTTTNGDISVAGSITKNIDALQHDQAMKKSTSAVIVPAESTSHRRFSRSKSDVKIFEGVEPAELAIPRSSDGFGNPLGRLNINIPNALDRGSRVISNASVKAIGQAFRSAGGFVKRLKTSREKAAQTSSLTYMGRNGAQSINTGFAFSHDTGMEDMLTPRIMAPVLESFPELEERKPKRNPSSASVRLRHLSARIQSVLGRSQPLTAQSKLAKPDELPDQDNKPIVRSLGNLKKTDDRNALKLAKSHEPLPKQAQSSSHLATTSSNAPVEEAEKIAQVTDPNLPEDTEESHGSG